MGRLATKHKTEAYGKLVPVRGIKKEITRLVEEVSDFEEKITITRDGEPVVVMVNAEVFEGMVETMAILSDSKAVAEIERALKNIEEGKVVPMEEVFD